jgi:hypothetical protein
MGNFLAGVFVTLAVMNPAVVKSVFNTTVDITGSLVRAGLDAAERTSTELNK